MVCHRVETDKQNVSATEGRLVTFVWQSDCSQTPPRGHLIPTSTCPRPVVTVMCAVDPATEHSKSPVETTDLKKAEQVKATSRLDKTALK